MILSYTFTRQSRANDTPPAPLPVVTALFSRCVQCSFKIFMSCTLFYSYVVEYEYLSKYEDPIFVIYIYHSRATDRIQMNTPSIVNVTFQSTSFYNVYIIDLYHCWHRLNGMGHTYN